MERLIDTIYNFKGKVEDCENDYILAVQRKLQYYEELESQGKFTIFPCNIGDTVYYIEGGYYTVPDYCKVCPIKVTEISKKSTRNGKNMDWAVIANGTRYKLSSFGKTVFNTYEAAEAELKRRKEEHALANHIRESEYER